MGRKRELLAHLIKSQDLKQVLVFCRTKQGASKLAHQLERDGIAATSIHGDKSQQQRTEALQAFKDGTVRVLVATDVAARGIDIDQLPYVVNFEIPHVPEDYVHRIGRTGRGGSTGTAISLVSEEELKLLDAIEKLLKRPIPSQTVPGFEAASAIVAHPERESHPRHERSEQRGRGDRGDRGGRGERGEHRPPRRGSGMIAADGFDFSKPYEPKPHLPPVIEAAYPHVEKKDTKKPKKPLAALFMPPAPPQAEDQQ
jgi:ATP-dependent RNA helicase RhlE